MTTIRLNPETDLHEVAHSITGGDSEIFGDEVSNTVSRLADIRATAERFCVRFTAEIPDCWGGTVSVTAYPSTRRSHWSF